MVKPSDGQALHIGSHTVRTEQPREGAASVRERVGVARDGRLGKDQRVAREDLRERPAKNVQTGQRRRVEVAHGVGEQVSAAREEC